MRDLFDVEGYVEKQAEAGVECTVLSYALEDGDALDGAKAEHDFLADLVGRYPGRFVALAALDPFGGEGWLAEGERALGLGLSGFCIPTSMGGRYPDSEEAADAWALAAERGAVVFLHPSAAPIEPERAGHRLVNAWVGRPYDTGICLSRMLLANTLSRYPTLRVVVAHSGGTLPMLLGRLDHVYEGMKRMSGFSGGGPPGGGPPGGGGPPKGPPGGAIPEHAAIHASFEGGPPSERLDQLYLDTASYHPAAIAAAIGAVGVDRVVFGSDFPPAGDSPRDAMGALDQAGLSESDLNKILTENARALLERAPQPVVPEAT